MNREEIEIQILPDGRVQYTIKGVKGSACQHISDLLEQLGEVERDEKTGEYYEQTDDTTISIRGG